MKKVVLSIVIVLVVFVGTLLFIKGSAPVVPVIPSPTTDPVSSPIVTYFCKEGSITASYSPSGVTLGISDGRKMDLPQVRSGSGTRYEQGAEVFVTKGSNAYLEESGMIIYNDCVAGTETSFKGMNTFTDSTKLFTFVFPNQFSLSAPMGFTTDWKVQQGNAQGMILAKVIIPKTFQPNTNFSEAWFSVGTSSDPDAKKNCVTESTDPATGNPGAPTTVLINRFPFTKVVESDAGAGNFYKTTSYRALRNDQCYAIEYTVHSTNIANYPVEDHITAYDEAKVEGIFDAMMQSFVFLQGK